LRVRSILLSMGNHPYIWGVLLPLVVSILVSVFSNEIRAVLGWAVSSSGRGLNQKFIALQEDRLKLIRVIEGNAYNLLLWLLLEIRPVVVETMVLCFIAIWIKVLRPNWWWYFPLSLLPGFWYGTFARINVILKYLQDPEKAKAELTRSIAVLKAGPPQRKSTVAQ